MQPLEPHRPVTGLELDDVSMDRQTVTFRPNAWRRLKTPGSHRVVRPGPISARFSALISTGACSTAGGRLLFPSPWSATELMIGDVCNLGLVGPSGTGKDTAAAAGLEMETPAILKVTAGSSLGMHGR
jgi:hypothetical protein